MGINALAAGGGQLAREYGAPEGVARGITTAGGVLTAPGAFGPWSGTSYAARATGLNRIVPLAAPTPWSTMGGRVGAGVGAAAGGAVAAGTVPPAGAPGYGAAVPGGVDTGIWGNIIAEPITRHITDKYGVVPGALTSLGMAGLGYYMGGKGMGLVGSGLNPWTTGARIAAKTLGGYYMAHTMAQQGYPSSTPSGQPSAMPIEAPSSFSLPMQ